MKASCLETKRRYFGSATIEHKLILGGEKESFPMLKNIEIIAKSPAFVEVISLARKVANSHANILITGESGTGKEIIAQLIHESSGRRDRPFVALNCAAIPENLLESELFGNAKGAYTGAQVSRVGLFEQAEGGTVFLDEIADLQLGLQAKILRVIQERKVKRVGENGDRPVDIRIIAATHENLAQAVQSKKFREDLYFRLNVISIQIPALRDRKEDIAALAEFFLDKHAEANGKSVEGFSPEAMTYLLQQPWPGNVRELENRIERAVVLTNAQYIQVQELELASRTESASDEKWSDRHCFDWLCQKQQRLLSIEELNQLYIQYALNRNRGAKDKTARELGIDRKTLYRKLQIFERDQSELKKSTSDLSPFQ